MIGDDPECREVHTRRAAKAHRCGECLRAVQPGETYEIVKGRWDSHWSIYRTCAHCAAAREWLSAVCRGWVYGAVHEDLVEHCRNVEASVPLARLASRLRRHWVHQGGLWAVADIEALTAEAIATYQCRAANPPVLTVWAS